MTLTEFLLARIAEDEAVARGVAEPLSPGEPFSLRFSSWESDHTDGDSAHVQQWRPERVLAECEAKRRIVEVHQQSSEEVWLDIPDSAWSYDRDACLCCSDLALTTNRSEWPCRTLRYLAAVYADHPDYNPEWSL